MATVSVQFLISTARKKTSGGFFYQNKELKRNGKILLSYDGRLQWRPLRQFWGLGRRDRGLNKRARLNNRLLSLSLPGLTRQSTLQSTKSSQKMPEHRGLCGTISTTDRSPVAPVIPGHFIFLVIPGLPRGSTSNKFSSLSLPDLIRQSKSIIKPIYNVDSRVKPENDNTSSTIPRPALLTTLCE